MRRYFRALLPFVIIAGLMPLGVARATPGAGTFTATADLGPSPIGSPIAIGVEEVATGLVSPVQLVQAPGAQGRRFIVDQVGVIWGLNPGGHLMPQPFLDISSKITPLTPDFDERGLLGLAFHPGFARNGRFFVFYTAPPRPSAPAGYNNTVTIAEYRGEESDPRGRCVGAHHPAGRPSTVQPRRWDGRVRARRLPLHLHRRRWRWGRR